MKHSDHVFENKCFRVASILVVGIWLTFHPSNSIAQLPDGLTKSRWAMDDPIYSEKYEDGASKLDLPGKVKQAADARFVEGMFGLYGAAGISSLGTDGDAMGTLEAGATGYWTSYFTNRFGLIAAVNSQDSYIGGETGLRLQTPTRLAPFVGLGLFAGYAESEELADNDHVDNNDDGRIDEWGEEKTRFDGVLAAIYPEAGIHFWWTPRVRLSAYARQMITTEGRDSDTVYFGGTIGVFSR
ncbi:hypothetical protein SH528x_005934 [Novipirellula sp. SH528]|uniref:hypothetical protein n=1 Tax=Novipirellula sp. SH528 TaxID=3454466 RepID=UPI003FA0F1E9